MAQLNQLVGIIELDADPELDAASDENLTLTLRRLRSVVSDIAPLEPHGLPFCSSDPIWIGVDDTLSDSVVVLKADLRRLRCELESELTRFLDRLLATPS